MRRAYSILVLCVLLGFGVSLAVQVEDVQETAYDESESLPCESTPVVFIAAPKAVRDAPAMRPGASQLLRTSLSGPKVRGSDRWAELHCAVHSSLMILNHSFRC